MKKQTWLQLAPLAFLLLGGLALWPLRHVLTAQAISRHVPETAAAAVLIALYAVKSLSFCFPLAALEAAGGLLFPYPLALIVNMAGVAVAQTLPFLLGRRSRGGVDALLLKYPRLEVLRALHRGSDALFVFLLRLAGASPGDLVSFYLGATGTPFPAYFSAGLLGILPRVAATTFLGTALWDIGSSRFWVSLGMNAAVTVLSLAIWRAKGR